MAAGDVITLFILSTGKWRKLLLLFQERWKIFSYGMSRALTGKPVSDVTGSQEKTVTHEWHYTSQVPLTQEMYDCSTDLYRQDEWRSNETLVTELDYEIVKVPNATMVTNEISHRSLYDQNDEWLSNLSFKLQKHKPHPTRPMPVDRHIGGLTASLYGNVAMAGGNYGHWMIDGLSRLFLIERHYKLSDFDHFLVPVLRYDFHRESLAALGIPENKIIEMGALECLKFDQLVATTSPRGKSSSVTPGWMIDNYRERLLGTVASQSGKRRIYVSRKDAGSRKFDNEDEIITLLQRYGFESVELSTYNFADKVRLFAEADVVVGLSGAGLTNVMFCPRGSTLIEFQPSTLASYMFTTIATYLGITVLPIFFDSESFLSRLNRYYGNLYLDPASIEEKLLLLDQGTNLE